MGWSEDDRTIARIAVPAFAALVAEPLMLVTDSIVVGRLGTVSLAGLAVASTVLTTVVGLCVFLAYGSTAAVSRRQGAGDTGGALSAGMDGVWLAGVLGVVLTALTAGLARPVSGAIASSTPVADESVAYLVVAALGVPAMLVVLAATGALRGVLDLRTPLLVMVLANVLNAVLSIWLVHGVGLGIRGAAIATVLAQWGAAAWLVGAVVRAGRSHGAALRPRADGMRAAGTAGLPLLVRTLTLRASLVVPTVVAGTLGDAPLAAHQVATTLVSLLAYALDAVAIAGQTLTGRALGAGDVVRTRRLVRRMTWWGVWSGLALGLLVAASAGVLPDAFTADRTVRDLLVPVLVVVGLLQPVSGIVFVLDGVLMGAGDGRYLALAGVVVLLLTAPLALVVGALGAGLTWLWAAYAAFMLARCATLVLRARGDRWMVLGA